MAKDLAQALSLARANRPRARSFAMMMNMATFTSEEEQPQCNAKLVFRPLERSLPSLHRGWRTPDPSPARKEMPQCVLPGEFIVEEDEYADPGASTPRNGRSPSPKPRGRSPTGKVNECLDAAEPSWARLRTPSPEPVGRMPPFMVVNLASCLPCEPQPQRLPSWEAATPDGSEDGTPTAAPVSVGSVGHPYSCNAACKYASKNKGCKDGANCDHCHLCKWKKSAAAAPKATPPAPAAGAAEGAAEKPKKNGKGQKAGKKPVA
mmetsp:Transcript_5578/g.9954  ORF Transcript_5578/g.9954 Transcript_5578/m.9954 type:complete len:263 (-) Transcript_5578:93-881(-)